MAGRSRLDDALAYAHRGWHVIPLHWPVGKGGCSCGRAGCESPAKHPRTPHGCKEATTDESVIRLWFRRWPCANVGIATEPSGLLVVDVDPRNGGAESWRLVVEHLGRQLDDAMTVTTGGGGRHLYFSLPPGTLPGSIRSRSGALGPGVDLKCAGGYVVAPASHHVDGSQYRWLANGIREPREAPEALLELAGRAQPPLPLSNGVSEIADSSQVPTAAIPRGARHETLKRTGVALRQSGLGLEAVRDLLLTLSDKHCETPLPAGEVTDLAGWAGTHVEGLSSVAVGPDFNPIPLDQFMKIDFPEPKWIVPGLIPEGCTVIAGPPKKGKSCTMHHVGLAVAAGGYAFGRFELEQGECLYYSLEGGPALFQERCRKLHAENGLPAFHVITESRTLGQGALDDMEGWLQARRDSARLVVVDTLVCMRDGVTDERKGIWRADYDSVKVLSALANGFGIGIVVVVHTTKMPSPTDPFNEITGTMGLQGAADTLIVMRGPRASNEAEIHAAGRRLDAPVHALTRWDGAEGAISWLGDVDEVQESGQQDEVLAALAEVAPSVVSPKELSDITGLDSGHVRMALSRLVRAHRIEKVGYGRYKLPAAEVALASPPELALLEREEDSM